MKTVYSKLLLSLLLIVTFNSASFSQYIESVEVSKEDLALFKESPLYVVQGIMNTEYDEQVEKAIKENWTVTEFKFIDATAYNEMYNDATKFFLIPDNFMYQRSKDFSVVEAHSYVKLKIIKGNGGAHGDTERGRAYPPVGLASVLYLMDDSFRLENLKFTEDSKEIKRNKVSADSAANWNNSIDTMKNILNQLVRDENGVNENILPVLIKNLHLQCTRLVPGKISGGTRMGKINDLNGLIRESPLYILDLDLNDKITSIEDVKQYYDGEVYVVSAQEYIELIQENIDVNIVTSVHDFEQNYVRIMNVKSGEVIYLVRSVVHAKYPAGVIKYHIKKW